MTATAASWKNEPFGEGIAIPYARTFTAAEFACLREGLVPREMEDKWFIHFEAPYLHVHRSWTGKPHFRVELAEEDGGARVVEALWDTSSAPTLDAGYQTRLLDFLIAGIMLREDVPFPFPSQVKDGKSALMFRHGIGGYRPSPQTAPVRPWWRFWR